MISRTINNRDMIPFHFRIRGGAFRILEITLVFPNGVPQRVLPFWHRYQEWII